MLQNSKEQQLYMPMVDASVASLIVCLFESVKCFLFCCWKIISQNRIRIFQIDETIMLITTSQASSTFKLNELEAFVFLLTKTETTKSVLQQKKPQ